MFPVILLMIELFGSSSGIQPQVRPVTGAYITEIKHPVLYDNTIPYFYNFPIVRMPRYLTINLLNVVILYALGYCCDLVTKNEIADLESNDENVEDFMKTVRTSVIQDHQALIKTLNITRIDHTYMSEELKKIEHWAGNTAKILVRQNDLNSRLEESRQESELISALISVTAAQLQYWLSYIMTISTILQTCRNEQLSTAAVHPTTLSDDLLLLQESLSHRNYSLAIRPGQLKRYFRLKLASCAVTNSVIAIRLQIPITSYPSRRLFELKRVPFLWENSTCHLRIESSLLSIEKTMAIIAGSDIHNCNPTTELCRVPAFHSDLLHGSTCPYKLLTNAKFSELTKHCLTECLPFQGAVITEIGIHKYVLAGLPKNTEIMCQTSSHPLLIPSVGSLEVELPSWNLPSNFNVSILTQHTFPTHANLSDVLNTNWTTDIPTLNLTIPEPLLLYHKRVPKLLHHSALLLPTFSFIWNLFLSLAVFWLMYQQYRALPWVITLSTLFKQTKADPDSHTMEQQGTILMTAVIINGIIILIVLLAAVYLLCRSIRTKHETILSLSSPPDVERPSQPSICSPSTSQSIHVTTFRPTERKPSNRNPRTKRGNPPVASKKQK
ncbi:unnamed protein product [Orchesella dallaii]|uniref:Envelope fusion protein n=1 Tax=Orchesella dallaii TaxID=48710 RepID=A0ABP1SAV7_9HEXA